MRATLAVLVLAVGLAAPLTSAAQSPTVVEATSPADADSLPVLEIEKNGWLAAAEAAGVNILLWTYNRFIREGGENPGFRIGPDSWKENIHNGFEWDDNSFSTNQFAHPYHGSLYFNAARSNGFDFWESAPFAFAGSFMWEYFMEKHHPSINDWVATSVGGIALGETLHRLSTMVVDNTATGSSRTWKEVGGFLINPMGGLNRLISGRMFDVYANPDDRYPSKLRFGYDIGLRTVGENRVWEADTTRVYMQFDLLYGDPFNGDSVKPYDSFDFTAQLNFNDKSVLGEVQAKGLLFLSELHSSAKSKHFLGAYQHFDYINTWAYEFGGQSISASYLSEIAIGESSLRTELHALGVILGGTKSDHENFTGRSYDYGPGLGFKFLTTLSRRGRPFFTFGHTDTWIYVLNGDEADHFISLTFARLDIQVRNSFGVGLEYDLYNAERRYANYPDVSQRSPEYRLFISWID